MSRTVLIATVAALFAGSVAEAQSPPQRPDRPGRPERPDGRPGAGLPPGAGTKLPPGMNRPDRPGNGGPSVQPPRPGRPEIQPPRPGNGGPSIQPPRPGRPDVQPPRPGRPEIQPPRPGRPEVRPPRPPGNWRPPHGGGNWNRPPVYRPGWNYPRGYNYRRWSAGLILPALFLNSAYYFTDYNTLGLYPPPSGYRWVRYGPDLLLVRKKNGKIREVYYGVFR